MRDAPVKLLPEGEFPIETSNFGASCQMFGCRNQLQTQFSGRYGASGAIGKAGPGANELNEPRIPAQYHELLVKNSLGCLSELGYPMLHHWLLI